MRGLDASSLAKLLSSSVLASDAVKLINEQMTRSVRELVESGALANMTKVVYSPTMDAIRKEFPKVPLPPHLLDQLRTASESWARLAVPQALRTESWDTLNGLTQVQAQLSDGRDADD